MTGPLSLTSNINIAGFLQEEKPLYERESTIMCLTRRIIYHGPVSDIKKKHKKELNKVLELSEDTLDKKINELENPTFILVYKG